MCNPPSTHREHGARVRVADLHRPDHARHMCHFEKWSKSRRIWGVVVCLGCDRSPRIGIGSDPVHSGLSNAALCTPAAKLVKNSMFGLIRKVDFSVVASHANGSTTRLTSPIKHDEYVRSNEIDTAPPCWPKVSG